MIESVWKRSKQYDFHSPSHKPEHLSPNRTLSFRVQILISPFVFIVIFEKKTFILYYLTDSLCKIERVMFQVPFRHGHNFFVSFGYKDKKEALA